MDKQIENLIKKIALRDVKLAMLKKQEEGLIISAEIMDEILKEIETNLQ